MRVLLSYLDLAATGAARRVLAVFLLGAGGVAIGLLGAEKCVSESQMPRTQPSTELAHRVAPAIVAIPAPVIPEMSDAHPSHDIDPSVGVSDSLIPFTVETVPSGAMVRVEVNGEGKAWVKRGTIVGPSPLTLMLAHGTRVKIRAELAGFKPWVSDERVSVSSDVEGETLNLGLNRRPTVATLRGDSDEIMK